MTFQILDIVLVEVPPLGQCLKSETSVHLSPIETVIVKCHTTQRGGGFIACTSYVNFLAAERHSTEHGSELGTRDSLGPQKELEQEEFGSRAKRKRKRDDVPIAPFFLQSIACHITIEGRNTDNGGERWKIVKPWR